MTAVDNTGRPYLAFNPEAIKDVFVRPKNATEVGVDICTFLSETLRVTLKATGVFSRELTTRDDLILAFLSVMLLLVIEGTLTTILLRTYKGNVSNIGFSVKQFIELARDFKLRFLVRGRRNANPEVPRRINFKLLITATSILLFIFGVEVLVLFLSSPRLIDVTNATTAFTLVEVVNPDWNEVRDNTGAGIIRPCTAVFLEGVEQDETQLNACLTSSGDTDAWEETLQPVNNDVEVSIVSDIHEFGAEHEIRIGEHSAKFTARAYFNLRDAYRPNPLLRQRLLRKRVMHLNRAAAIELVHKQYIAYLFTYYDRQFQDNQMDLKRLQGLKFNFSTEYGPEIAVIQIKQTPRFRKATSLRHTTNVTGVIPRGPEALRFALATLKASTAIALIGPDREDLNLESGSTWGWEALMWRETARTLNWLTLSLVLAAALMFFFALRWLLKPIATAEIAGAFVTSAVGADQGRPPAWLQTGEVSDFRLSFESRTSSTLSLSLGQAVRRIKSGSSHGTSLAYSDSSI